jgi:hypothetical protein
MRRLQRVGPRFLFLAVLAVGFVVMNEAHSTAAVRLPPKRACPNRCRQFPCFSTSRCSPLTADVPRFVGDNRPLRNFAIVFQI